MAELVDALDLGSSFFGSEGSSPFVRIFKGNQQTRPGASVAIAKILTISLIEGVYLKLDQVQNWREKLESL